MTNFGNRITPYRIFWWSIPVVITLMLIISARSYDFQLHSTYFVVGSIQLTLLFTLFLGLLGAIYWLLRKHSLNKTLSILHVAVSLLSFAIVLMRIHVEPLVGANGTGYVVGLQPLEVFAIGALVLAQLVLLVNIVQALVKGRG